ncbi:conserved Plasmodium protein, unknown function, partial [Plasmodium malariae]
MSYVKCMSVNKVIHENKLNFTFVDFFIYEDKCKSKTECNNNDVNDNKWNNEKSCEYDADADLKNGQLNGNNFFLSLIHMLKKKYDFYNYYYGIIDKSTSVKFNKYSIFLLLLLLLYKNANCNNNNLFFKISTHREGKKEGGGKLLNSCAKKDERKDYNKNLKRSKFSICKNDKKKFNYRENENFIFCIKSSKCIKIKKKYIYYKRSRKKKNVYIRTLCLNNVKETCSLKKRDENIIPYGRFWKAVSACRNFVRRTTHMLKRKNLMKKYVISVSSMNISYIRNYIKANDVLLINPGLKDFNLVKGFHEGLYSIFSYSSICTQNIHIPYSYMVGHYICNNRNIVDKKENYLLLHYDYLKFKRKNGMLDKQNILILLVKRYSTDDIFIFSNCKNDGRRELPPIALYKVEKNDSRIILYCSNYNECHFNSVRMETLLCSNLMEVTALRIVAIIKKMEVRVMQVIYISQLIVKTIVIIMAKVMSRIIETVIATFIATVKRRIITKMYVAVHSENCLKFVRKCNVLNTTKMSFNKKYPVELYTLLVLSCKCTTYSDNGNKSSNNSNNNGNHKSNIDNGINSSSKSGRCNSCNVSRSNLIIRHMYNIEIKSKRRKNILDENAVYLLQYLYYNLLMMMCACLFYKRVSVKLYSYIDEKEITKEMYKSIFLKQELKVVKNEKMLNSSWKKEYNNRAYLYNTDSKDEKNVDGSINNSSNSGNNNNIGSNNNGDNNNWENNNG